MASKFQKDLYNKRGALFSMWDVCIGLGLSLILTGLGLKAKDKYLPVRIGSRKEEVKEVDDIETPKETPVKTDKDSSALSKLGL